MTPPASPEASEVRRRGQRRLIGAVAIVLLLVVFVPMLLDSEPRRASTGPELQIPPRDNPRPLPAPVPPSPKMAAATPTPGRESPSPQPSPKGEGEQRAPQPSPKGEGGLAAKVVPEATRAAAEAQLAVVEPQAVAKKAEVLKVESPSPKPKAESPSPRPSPKGEGETPKLEGFAIQVGAFRDEDKLKQAREKLAAAGVVHYTERVENPGGPITRLRAGPFPTRPAAEATMDKIKGVSPDAKVVPLP